MGAGALDAVETPTLGSGGVIANGEKLLARLAKLDAALAGSLGSGPVRAYCPGTPAGDLPPLVLLGASTGGPEALAVVLSAFPKEFPAAVLVAQHIGAEFVGGLVQQLAARTPLPVRLARTGEPPTAGTVLVASSDDHLELAPDHFVRYTPEPRSYPYRPSIDVLFGSAGATWPRLGVGALLTGMGTDGAEGLLRLRALGWHTIAQDEATCVVYGMPKVAAEKKAAVETLPLSQIGPSIAAKMLTARKR
jgi:two-component system response regulator WspF